MKMEQNTSTIDEISRTIIILKNKLLKASLLFYLILWLINSYPANPSDYSRDQYADTSRLTVMLLVGVSGIKWSTRMLLSKIIESKF